ncbi:MAG: hypothetical protein EXQ81_11745 [Thermoleophilia bacterium]|nr:hypothetical protein [Thermoleophilia bacterium]
MSGASRPVAGNVYVATLSRRTFAVDGRTGRRVWSFPDGQYSPLVADADHAYLIGTARIFALTDKR